MEVSVGMGTVSSEPHCGVGPGQAWARWVRHDPSSEVSSLAHPSAGPG